jgi:nucleoside-diphosphate-sugar epimerase
MIMNEKVGSLLAVTGANGFVGTALCRELHGMSFPVRPIVRGKTGVLPGESRQISGIASDTDWRPALEGVGCIIHCAARVHVMRESTEDPLAAFRAVNVAG